MPCSSLFNSFATSPYCLWQDINAMETILIDGLGVDTALTILNTLMPRSENITDFLLVKQTAAVVNYLVYETKISQSDQQ